MVIHDSYIYRLALILDSRISACSCICLVYLINSYVLVPVRVAIIIIIIILGRQYTDYAQGVGQITTKSFINSKNN